MNDTDNAFRIGCAILGSGNIGTDLLIKLLRNSKILRPVAMAGIDPASDGLARAARLGVKTTTEGLDGLLKMPEFSEVRIVFDATSAALHRQHAPILRAQRVQAIDLTPAAVGPYVIPIVNLNEELSQDNVNMVTCGGQATIPIVHAVARASRRVPYAEIVSSVASRSAGPGTRANIDEFTETTARAIEKLGRAEKGKAIIVMNPAEPPLLMRNTVFTLSQGSDEEEIDASIAKIVSEVQQYVPGYRLKQKLQFERFDSGRPLRIPGYGEFEGLKTSVFLEVEGAAHYLPAFAGNLDIMTSAALATGERVAELKFRKGVMA